MFPLTRYSADREGKSLGLNEYRVPLEGSLSMPTSVLAKRVIAKRVLRGIPWRGESRGKNYFARNSRIVHNEIM